MAEMHKCPHCGGRWARAELRQVQAVGHDYRAKVDYCCPKPGCGVVLFWTRPTAKAVRP